MQALKIPMENGNGNGNGERMEQQDEARPDGHGWACDARDMESLTADRALCNVVHCRMARGPWTFPAVAPHWGLAAWWGSNWTPGCIATLWDRAPSSPLYPLPGQPKPLLIPKRQLDSGHQLLASLNRTPSPSNPRSDSHTEPNNPSWSWSFALPPFRRPTSQAADFLQENNLCDTFATPRSPTQLYTLPPWRTIPPAWPASKRPWSRSTECPG